MGRGGSYIFLPNTLYIGIDESNHGRFPETFAGAVTRLEQDIIQSEIEKKSIPISRVLGFFNSNKRDYSVLSLEKEDKIIIPRTELIGGIGLSLVYNHIPIDVERLMFLIDGSGFRPSRESDYLKEIVSENTRFERKCIGVEFIPQADATIPLVNWADSIAHYFFRKPERLIKNKHLVGLLQ